MAVTFPKLCSDKPKTAARFVSRLVQLGAPPPTNDELVRYLREALCDPTVHRANVPLAVACTEDRFAPWLDASRRRTARAEALRAAAEAAPLAPIGPRRVRLAAGSPVALVTGAAAVVDALARRKPTGAFAMGRFLRIDVKTS